jgi:hypothetical protein
MATVNKTLVATGSVTLTLGTLPADNLVVIQTSGTYVGVSFVFEGSADGTNWSPMIGQRSDAPAIWEGGSATVLLDQSVKATTMWQLPFPSGALQQVRFRCTVYSSGNLTVQMNSSYVPGNPSPAPTNSQVSNVSNSATGAAAAVAPAIAAVAGKLNYITGFDVTGTGATTALALVVTVTGPTNTLNYSLLVPSGVLVDLGVNRLSVRFPQPIPASAQNTAITLNIPNFGSGNTQSSGAIYGFQV